MSNQWTLVQVAAHNARVRKENRIQATDNEPTPDGHEADLHAEIAQECRRQGWIALHGSMAHKARRTPGEFDFVVLGDGGRTYCIECKTKSTKQTKEQRDLHHHARKLGHTSAVVRSLAEFVAVVDGGTLQL